MCWCLVTQSCPTLCDPMDCSPPGSSVHGDSPGKNTGVGCHALFQGIFPTQGSNPGLLHCRWILYCLSHQGSFPVKFRLLKSSWFSLDKWGDSSWLLIRTCGLFTASCPAPPCYIPDSFPLAKLRWMNLGWGQSRSRASIMLMCKFLDSIYMWLQTSGLKAGIFFQTFKHRDPDFH